MLTPVKNEEWILDRFLAVTSRFADLIVVADQGSTDGSAAICRRYPKVDLIANPAQEFNEAQRQILLLRHARERVPGPKVLLALDADEVLAADALEAPGWRRMLAAAPGTVLCFEKPDLYETPAQCLRYDTPWPLGYVDDGVEHTGTPIHSLRIPTPPGAPRLAVEGVKVLHYALTRLEYQAAKIRYYSVMENLLGTQGVPQRRRAYAADTDWSLFGRLEPSPREWFAGWEQEGIDMATVHHQEHSWQDFEVLRLFSRHGERRFWLDAVWDFDWEACRQQGKTLGLDGLPARPVRPPGAVVRLAGAALDHAYDLWLSLRGVGPRPRKR